jgi:hypothetical protein
MPASRGATAVYLWKGARVRMTSRLMKMPGLLSSVDFYSGLRLALNSIADGPNSFHLSYPVGRVFAASGNYSVL